MDSPTFLPSSANEIGYQQMDIIASDQGSGRCVVPYSNVAYDAADFLKTLLVESTRDRHPISIVAFGLKRSCKVLGANEQLRGRFGKPIPFGELSLKDVTQFKNYLSILKSFRLALPQFTVPKDNLPSFHYRIHYASFGLPGYTLKILRRAVKIARGRQTSELSWAIMSDAYLQLIFEQDEDVPNPFSEKFDIESAPPRELPTEERPPRASRFGGRQRLKLKA